jgi:hypothetical protein
VTPNAQLVGFILAICIPSFTALIGVLLSNVQVTDVNGRIADLRSHIDARFGFVDEKLKRVEEIMDARLTRIEDQLHIR